MQENHSIPVSVSELETALAETLLMHRPKLRKLWRMSQESQRKPEEQLQLQQKFLSSLEDSRALVQTKKQNVPVLEFPENLPVSMRREEIAATIRDHQVVILAGETGSGKTTQLPKICLELGRGIFGQIGHTQP